MLAIKVDVLSYNEEQFRYWENIKAVFDQTGNITDRLPARISGGLTSNNEAEILGNFSVVGQSEKVIFLRNPDVERNVKPVCGIPGFQPRPLPDECCQCLSREGASLEKPFFPRNDQKSQCGKKHHDRGSPDGGCFKKLGDGSVAGCRASVPADR